MIKFKDFIQDSCNVTPGFEYYLKNRKKIDLLKLKNLIKGDYYLSNDNSPFYISIKDKKSQITIFSSLKIIVKDIEIQEESDKIVNQLLKYINKLN